ncbi:MAG: NADH pyrophosphatase, partial [Roseovarius sp.]|nr:NADH pyrophosphatase [Roseovarius sp.]
MRTAEQVTFGGSGLDRADELRGDEAMIQAAMAEGRARAIVLWRGKPLLRAETLDGL